jgi:hypothetical protein
VVPGVSGGPELFILSLGGDLDQRDGLRGGVVETRRLELLTLSLQRRCSSS